SFDAYFAVFPWELLPDKAVGFDLGCGSGRWAKLMAPRVAELHCIDPSEEALRVARKNLAAHANCRFHLAGVDNIPLPDSSMDFGYALGVLHHVPHPTEGIRSCVAKLKSGAPLLLYLYYAFDNKPPWFKALWKISDYLRRLLSRSPFPVKYLASQLIAAFIYYPLAKAASVVERLGGNVGNMPLSNYKDKCFYTMRTDALDRFGTRLERRFTKKQIEEMMLTAGLIDIRFGERPPYWCAVGIKA
ncbi:MAG TPA: methyltransferase domain-containing protein, partial [Chthonomonadales bacterium]|nr:methyltransferase domain-containing protein [Chthonomonadales bacterium]